MEILLVASLLLNLVGVATSRMLRGADAVGSAVAFGLQAFMASAKIINFDKKQEIFFPPSLLRTSDQPGKITQINV